MRKQYRQVLLIKIIIPEAKGALATIRQLIFAGRYPEAQALAGEKILSKNGFGIAISDSGQLASGLS